MGIEQDVLAFFDACETGKGWDACQQWCKEGATFAAQADALADVTTVEGYTEWMAHLAPALPDMGYEMLGFAFDEERQTVLALFFGRIGTGVVGPGIERRHCASRAVRLPKKSILNQRRLLARQWRGGRRRRR